MSRGRARNRNRGQRRVKRLAREMHLVHDADADAAAGIVGDEFTVTVLMDSPWGDRWTWEVDVETAQQVNDLLGKPKSFVIVSTPVDKPVENS